MASAVGMTNGHLIADLADRYESVSADLRDLARANPGAHVVRNDVGNLAVVTAGGTYLGYIDVLTGEVVTHG